MVYLFKMFSFGLIFINNLYTSGFPSTHRQYCSHLGQCNKINAYTTTYPQRKLHSLSAGIMDLSSDEYLSTHIFCNVELNGNNLEAIGFDMDFTLAQYNEEFDKLAFEGAKKNLVFSKGYPEEVLGFQYDSKLFCRGLVIDKSRGNFLKMDRHKYVRKVYHGLRELSREERKSIYLTSYDKMPTYSESNFVNIDTIFGLVDALLFALLVDMCDKSPSLKKSYSELYTDVRACVERCHHDGVIKDAVKANPNKYIIYDSNTLPMLLRLKEKKLKVFLLTNSLYDYTTAVMEYLIHGNGEVKQSRAGIHCTNKEDDKKLEWQQLFDVVIVGAQKPGFMADDYLGLYRVDRNGQLENIEDKDALVGSGCQLMDANYINNKNINVFQGGCWQDLNTLLSITSPDRILYVGDHMYSDILKSRRQLGWRTCLIIPELEHEISTAKEYSELAITIRNLRRLQYDLDEYLDSLEQRASMNIPVMDQYMEAELKKNELKVTLATLSEEYDKKHNVRWGQMFKAGYQDSRFARQVLNYACLYTSKATNLAFVSPRRSFRSVQDFMAHDQVLFDAEDVFSSTMATND